MLMFMCRKKRERGGPSSQLFPDFRRSLYPPSQPTLSYPPSLVPFSLVLFCLFACLLMFHRTLHLKSPTSTTTCTTQFECSLKRLYEARRCFFASSSFRLLHTSDNTGLHILLSPVPCQLPTNTPPHSPPLSPLSPLSILGLCESAKAVAFFCSLVCVFYNV